MKAASGRARLGARELEDANRQHAARACDVGGQCESQRPGADDVRMRAEAARAAEQLAIPIEFVAILDLRRPEDVPRGRRGGHVHHASIPRVTGVAGMSMRHPPVDMVGQTDVVVVTAWLGGQVDRLPRVVVIEWIRPARVIAGMESPTAVEQRRRGAQCRRIGPAAAREIDDHDGQRQHARQDDRDEQPALRSVDRLDHCASRLRLRWRWTTLRRDKTCGQSAISSRRMRVEHFGGRKDRAASGSRMNTLRGGVNPIRDLIALRAGLATWAVWRAWRHAARCCHHNGVATGRSVSKPC